MITVIGEEEDDGCAKPITRSPSGLVGNLHTCLYGSREFDSGHHNLCSFFRSGKREHVSK